MRVRGHRRRRAVDRGFVLSDHVDWPSLLAAIRATEAECVWVTHGYREPVVRWLREHGLRAHSVASRWEGESDEADLVVEEGGTAPVVEPPVDAEERPEPAKLDTLDDAPGFG